MGKSVLIVAAHPDDEVLGCGGIIARHARAGDRVNVLLLAEGATAREGLRDEPGAVAALRDAAVAAARVLGAGEPRFCGFPDNRLDTVPMLDLIRPIETLAREIEPHTVYTHHHGDLNVDHRLTHEAVVTAFRPTPGRTAHALYAFEVLSSTGWAAPSRETAFAPTRFVDIGETLEAKIAALDCYRAEMRAFPHARSVEAVRALAACRGASVGLHAAEALCVIREILPWHEAVDETASRSPGKHGARGE